jgi:ADP-ribose pyrophosphatase
MSAHTVYEGRVFSVEVDTIPLRNGREAEVAIVRHRPSVVLLPLNEDGRITLIRQYRHALGRDIWELPAGSVDAAESAEEAAARECEEEIGQVPSRIERIGIFYPTPGYCDEQMIFFRVSGLHAPPADSPHKADEDEEITCEAVTPDAAKAMVANGEIVDLKTAYALTLL